MPTVVKFGPEYVYEATRGHNPTATLKLHGTSTTEPTYNSAGTSTAPIAVSSSGHVTFYAPTGTYDIVFSFSNHPDALAEVTLTGPTGSAEATDDEVAAAVATLTTALAAKQDATTAATDTELADAVATLTTALATKQASATAATDVELAAAIALSPGSEITSAPLAASFTPGSNAVVDVTGWSVMVPANSGNVQVWCPTGVSLSATTGTNSATTQQRISVYITNDLGVQVAFASWVFYGTGTTQTVTNHVAIGGLISNDASDRTYRVQMQASKQGTSSASGTVNAGGIFPNLALQAVRR